MEKILKFRERIHKRPKKRRRLRNIVLGTILASAGIFGITRVLDTPAVNYSVPESEVSYVEEREIEDFQINESIPEEREITFEEKIDELEKVFQKGFVLLSQSREDYSSVLHHKSINGMKELGVEWISLYIPLYQDYIDSNEIYSDEMFTPSDASLENIINDIHRAGMHVTLEMVMDIKNVSPGDWLGELRPENWDAWFQNYGSHLEHYAKFSQENQVEQLIIGAEMNSAHEYKENWEQLIDNVKENYQGLVVYAANFDAFETVSFWDKLDSTAMNFYFSVNRREDLFEDWSTVEQDYHDPSFEELVNGWDLWVNQIDNWQDQIRKPVIITEIGYPSQRGSTYRPWSLSLGASNFEEQFLAYDALYHVWHQKQITENLSDTGNYLKGIYFYRWGNEKSVNSRSYVPSGDVKSLIQEWFIEEETGGVVQ